MLLIVQLNIQNDFALHYITLHYITCYLLVAFIQSDLHTQYCGQSPQEQFGVKCLAQGHNDMLTAAGFEPVLPWSKHQRSIDCATRLHALSPHSRVIIKWVITASIICKKLNLLAWYKNN